MSESVAARPRPKPKMNPKMWWLVQFRTWHWISGALCLGGILLFAITGITLNHAGEIEAKPQVTTRDAVLPADLLPQLTGTKDAPVAAPIATFIDTALDIDIADKPADWQDDEVYIALPRPGGDAWLSIDRASGDAHYERTDRGWVSYLNDLHKGRNTGPGWQWFIDIFAVACVIFSLSGLGLLTLYARGRKSTWPLVGAGLLVPALLAILLIH